MGLETVKSVEKLIQSCYSTWSKDYYKNYYASKSAYPPVHREILKALLKKHKVKRLLDAGCGPASFLRDLTHTKMELWGFDLTPEMVEEANLVLSQKGYPQDSVWQGSVLDPKAFRHPRRKGLKFDGAVCIGVLPHIPVGEDENVISNLKKAVQSGGLVVLEARNQLFSLFTLNRYSYEFFMQELVQEASLRNKTKKNQAALDEALQELQKRFRMDLPLVRKGKQGEPGYDEVLSRTHNPFVLKEKFEKAGFKDVQIHFYHYHCMPPQLERFMPNIFRKESMAMEDPSDWRGYFMASAFLLSGKKAK
jgi:2-polyprenyl-3-methyl-5-hydroxy-6-metoxy-1,4-benzoquinol methylase